MKSNNYYNSGYPTIPPPISRTIGRKYRDREMVARCSKVPNMVSGHTPVESTDSEFSDVEQPKWVKNHGEKLYTLLV